MRLQEFGKLPINEQARYVWQYGKYLASRAGNYGKGNLYAVDAFFVEIWYDAERNTIVALLSFEDTDRLNSYLNEVSLDDLLQ